MNARNDIREFLISRRAKITPEQVGLPAYGGARRRVAGLRREEVAMLAGISVEYYTRLERGTTKGVSDDVIEGVARALHLDGAERAHLVDLVRAAHPNRPPRRRLAQQRVRPQVQQMLDAMAELPAYLRNGRLDILATNPLGQALYSEVLADPVQPANLARFIFLNPRAPQFFVDWQTVANDAVAILRTEAGRDPYDRQLSDLIGELSTRSHDFRVRWAAHDVKLHCAQPKRLHHPLVGDLTLSYEGLDLPSDPGQMILVYTAEPDSPSREALDILASWSSTPPEPAGIETDGQH